jgi:hypothetical protein
VSDSHLPPGNPPNWQGPGTPPPASPPPMSPAVGETLAMGGGAPWPPGADASPRSGGLKKVLLLGGAAIGAGAVGVGAWAAIGFFSTGAQPAEALPDTTLAYASIDLDPSGGQKIEALTTLNKFPAFKDELNLDTEDNLVREVVDRILAEAPCEGLDFADDFEPWLGSRLAVAAIDGGDDEPFPVVVIQSSDEAAAEAGLAEVAECDESDELAFEVSGDWVVLAETQAQVTQVVADTAEGSLADDATFKRWTDEAGDAGIVTLYAGPGVGDFLGDNPMLFLDPLGSSSVCAGVSSGGSLYDADADAYYSSTDEYCADADAAAEEQIDDELSAQLRDFDGGAAVVRFADGALEMQVAFDGRSPVWASNVGSAPADVVQTLPADTAVALSYGFSDGWAEGFLDALVPLIGADMSVDELLREAEAASGLTLPEDIETLLGSSAALALSADVDFEEFFTQPDPSGLPIALKVEGSPEEIEAVLDKVRSQLPAEEAAFIDSDADGAMIVIGPNPEYRERVLEDGGLGDDPVFRDVVREADRSSYVVFVNLNTFEDAIASLAGEDPDGAEIVENLKPLAGIGSGSWIEDGVGHVVLRITTD